MTAKDLKNSILQLAVQGRLVPQNPDDEPVCLSKNRQKSVDECLFDIPESWRLAHIESICNTIPSKPYQILESEVQKSGLFHVISQSKEYSIGFSNNRNKVFHHDSPVVAFGDHTTTVKYLAFDFVIGADGVKLFLPKPEVVDAKFFFYALQYHVIGLDKVGGYSRHYKFIKNKPIPLPPLTEQKRIVAKIEDLMPLVEEYGKTEERLSALNAAFPDALRKSILQQAIQGKLTRRDPADEPASELLKLIRVEKTSLLKSGKIRKEKPLPPITEDEIPFEVPEEWAWVRLGDLGALYGGYTFKSSEYTSSGIQVVRISDLSEDGINTTGAVFYPDNHELCKFRILQNSFLICLTGSIGKMAWIQDDTPRYLNQRIGMFLPHNPVLSGYLWLYLHTPFAQNTLMAAKTSMNGNIKNSDVTGLPCPLPPLAEQERIVSRVNELLAMCDDLKAISNHMES